MTAASPASIARDAFPPFAQINLDPPFFLNLLAPALLLALLKKWTSLLAPAYGVYFTAEAVTILYAYFALARTVYVYNRGRDREGRHDRARARKATQDFHRAWPTVAAKAAFIALPLLAVAIATDCATHGIQFRAQQATESVILIVEIVVWLLVAPTFIIAFARWSPTQPFDFPCARRLATANRSLVGPSFLIVALFLAVGTRIALEVLYQPLRALVVAAVPTWTAIFLYSTVFYAFIAAFALWMQCRWSAAVAPKLKEPPFPPLAPHEPDWEKMPGFISRRLRPAYEQSSARSKPRSGQWRLVSALQLFPCGAAAYWGSCAILGTPGMGAAITAMLFASVFSATWCLVAKLGEMDDRAAFVVANGALIGLNVCVTLWAGKAAKFTSSVSGVDAWVAGAPTSLAWFHMLIFAIFCVANNTIGFLLYRFVKARVWKWT